VRTPHSPCAAVRFQFSNRGIQIGKLRALPQATLHRKESATRGLSSAPLHGAAHGCCCGSGRAVASLPMGSPACRGREAQQNVEVPCKDGQPATCLLVMPTAAVAPEHADLSTAWTKLPTCSSCLGSPPPARPRLPRSSSGRRPLWSCSKTSEVLAPPGAARMPQLAHVWPPAGKRGSTSSYRLDGCRRAKATKVLQRRALALLVAVSFDGREVRVRM
jgi:hypothetical protein